MHPCLAVVEALPSGRIGLEQRAIMETFQDGASIEMALQRYQLSLRTLLFVLTLLVCAVGVQATMFESYPFAGPLFTMVLGAAYGFVLQARRGQSVGFGGILGGAVGGIVATILDVICGFTLIENFETEGLGFVGTVCFLSPIGAFFGAAVGAILSLLAYPILLIVTKRWRLRCSNRSGGVRCGAENAQGKRTCPF